MSKRLFLAAAMTAAVAMPSFALAQTTNATGSSDGSAAGLSWFTMDNVGGFFTDDSMSTLRPSTDMQAAYAKMTPENQAKLKTECAATTDRKFSDLCQAVNAM